MAHAPLKTTTSKQMLNAAWRCRCINGVGSLTHPHSDSAAVPTCIRTGIARHWRSFVPDAWHSYNNNNNNNSNKYSRRESAQGQHCFIQMGLSPFKVSDRWFVSVSVPPVVCRVDGRCIRKHVIHALKLQVFKRSCASVVSPLNA